jgi:uncharacterized protein (TIGR03382 family)
VPAATDGQEVTAVATAAEAAPSLPSAPVTVGVSDGGLGDGGSGDGGVRDGGSGVGDGGIRDGGVIDGGMSGADAGTPPPTYRAVGGGCDVSDAPVLSAWLVVLLVALLWRRRRPTEGR